MRGRAWARGGWRWVILAGAVLLAGGCGHDDPARPDDESTPVRAFWHGTYASDDGSDHGTLALDVLAGGGQATAELVVRSSVHDDPNDHVYLEGTAAPGALDLQLDRNRIPYAFEFDLQGTEGADGSLTGSFSHPTFELTATFACRGVEVDTLTVESFYDLHATVLGLACDSSAVWASTMGWDYLVVDNLGAVLDTVVVYIWPETHWTSDALTFDGSNLFGHLPITVNDGDVVSDESDIVEFTREGEIVRQFRTGRRTSGLAWDGTHLWSLPIKSDMLFCLDDSGAPIDSLTCAVPDLADIAYRGDCFWAVGAWLQRLYQIDRTGEILRVYDLPRGDIVQAPMGIACDDSTLWYCCDSWPLSRIYRLSVD